MVKYCSILLVKDDEQDDIKIFTFILLAHVQLEQPCMVKYCSILLVKDDEQDEYQKYLLLYY